MGALKRWMHDVHDDCLSMGVYNTSKKHSMTIDDVKTTTMNYANWDKSWAEFISEHDLKKTMAKSNEAAKKRGS